MTSNKFASQSSSNNLTGYAISGVMLSVDFSNYSFSCSEPKYATIVLYQYVGHELETAVQVNVDALFNFVEYGEDDYEHSVEWPRGDVDKWSFRTIGEFVHIVAKCHTGGQIFLSLRDAKYIAERAKETRDLMWEEGKEFRKSEKI